MNDWSLKFFLMLFISCSVMFHHSGGKLFNRNVKKFKIMTVCHLLHPVTLVHVVIKHTRYTNGLEICITTGLSFQLILSYLGLLWLWLWRLLCFIHLTKKSIWLSSVDGVWATWNQWSSCTKTCGSGLQTRNRTCTFPSPTAPHGRDCQGHGLESKTCNTNFCTGELDSFID